MIGPVANVTPISQDTIIVAFVHEWADVTTGSVNERTSFVIMRTLVGFQTIELYVNKFLSGEISLSPQC